MRGAEEGLCARRVRVEPEHVVYVKGILEASEGLASMFAEQGGELILASAWDREAALEELLQDLVDELGAELLPAEEAP